MTADAQTDDVHNLTSLLDVLLVKFDADVAAGGEPKVSVEAILDLVGRRAYGPLLLLIGLLSISPATLIPGATSVCATLTLLVALQLTLHKETPWLPKAALKLELSESQLDKFIKAARPIAKFIDTIVKPRFAFITDPPWVAIIGLMCVLAALLTYPLSLIPIAPIVPGFAICLFGLGLTARDGVLLALGAVLMGGAGWLLFDRVF
jgi:hypothetical protein